MKSHFLTSTKYADRRFGIVDNFAFVILTNKITGGVFVEQYLIERQFDAAPGVSVYTLTLREPCEDRSHEVRVGNNPHCTCKSWEHGNGTPCKHYTIVDRYIEESAGDK